MGTPQRRNPARAAVNLMPGCSQARAACTRCRCARLSKRGAEKHAAAAPAAERQQQRARARARASAGVPAIPNTAHQHPVNTITNPRPRRLLPQYLAAAASSIQHPASSIDDRHTEAPSAAALILEGLAISRPFNKNTRHSPLTVQSHHHRHHRKHPSRSFARQRRATQPPARGLRKDGALLTASPSPIQSQPFSPLPILLSAAAASGELSTNPSNKINPPNNTQHFPFGVDRLSPYRRSAAMPIAAIIPACRPH
ncbi:hypothetical protein B0J12DRAFT_701346 [Macrophomina phaseolina]|uniref:Uncharacterized protein n=1 Tax=Macrophomina phaseolina TaxID=35725 RepID=A0ABQ8G5C0_9PEZI|nr:hypothetical protein B0J12DRAFT_701346 [Macrophomina phaseolina]